MKLLPYIIFEKIQGTGTVPIVSAILSLRICGMQWLSGLLINSADELDRLQIALAAEAAAQHEDAQFIRRRPCAIVLRACAVSGHAGAAAL